MRVASAGRLLFEFEGVGVGWVIWMAGTAEAWTGEWFGLAVEGLRGRAGVREGLRGKRR